MILTILLISLEQSFNIQENKEVFQTIDIWINNAKKQGLCTVVAADIMSLVFLNLREIWS